MHREQVEAIAQEVLERRFGDSKTLDDLQTILQRTNINMTAPGESDEPARQAKLIHSMVMSHSNLAKALGGLAEAAERLQERIAQLEASNAAMQEAIINLQIRLRHFEGEDVAGTQS